MKRKFPLLVICCLSLISVCAFAQTTGSLDQSANNAQGQYQPMDMGYAGFNSLGMTQAAWLDPLQNLGEGQSKPAYSRYYWNKDLVLPIRIREAMVTIINFPEWEMIETVQFGDNNSFAGEIVGPNSVLLWAKGNIGVDTNVIMFGRSGNKYVFYVKSESVDTERLTNAIIDIEIPDEEQLGSGSSSSGYGRSNTVATKKTSTYTKRFNKEDWLKEIPFNPATLKFDMEVYVPNPDDVVIAPERVWRDDIFTYIDLGNRSLTMVQRPIVTQIVERSEVPVGFRTKGPDNRLIIVEGIGDFVLRNGKRMICLKMRRDDSRGLDGYSSADDDPRFANEWDVPSALPNVNATAQSRAKNNGIEVDETYVDFDDYLDSQTRGKGATQYKNKTNAQKNKNSMSMVPAKGNSPMSASGYDQSKFGYGSGFAVDNIDNNISIQLGTDADISKMEELWTSLSTKYPDVVKGYEPFFSVDAPADGQGKELFHLRVGPVKSLEEGDNTCAKLGRKGVFCSVIRTQ